MARIWNRISNYKAAILSLFHESLCKRSRYRAILQLSTLISIVSSASAPADEWTLKGSLWQQAQYNDNIGLTSSLQQSVIGYLLAPSLQATLKTGRFDMDFNGLGDIRRYDDSRWDCDNYNLGLNSAYRTDRNVFSLRGVYSSNCSYSQQVSDTGILLPTLQTQNYKVSPAWAWKWTPRIDLFAETSYSNTSYTGIGGSSGSAILSGNETYFVNIGGNHLWSPRIILNGTVYYSHIQYTGANTTVQYYYGIQSGVNYIISQKWKASIGAGPRISNMQSQSSGVSTAQNATTSIGYTANVNLNYNGELTSLSLGYSNSILPSAIGQTVQNQSFYISYLYRIKQNISLDLITNYTNSQSIGSQTGSNLTSNFNRDYLSASLGLAWQINKDWQLKGSYLYRWQHYPQQGTTQSLFAGTADSNTVMLFLNYAWDGVSNAH